MTRLPDDQFERLVCEHHAAVYRAARRVTADAAAAADVAQDVFVRVLCGRVRLDGSDHVRASLCWLSARLAHNAVRARRRRRQHEENAMPSSRRDSRGPVHQAAAADLHAAVQQCVGELPEQLRVPLELHLQEELTLASVGSALRLSTSTVHGRVQQALQRLRTALQGRGLAIAAAALPDLVRQVPPPAVPVGLEAQLLATGSSAALAAATAGGVRRLAVAAGLALAAVVAVVAVLVLADDQGSGGVAPAVSTSASLERAGEAHDVLAFDGAFGAAGGSSGREREIVLTPAPLPVEVASIVSRPDRLELNGSVHDAAAWPVVGAQVTALAAGGLKPFELGSVTTDHLGAFRLRLELGKLQPTAIRLAVAEEGVRVLLGEELAATAELAQTPIALQLPAAAGVATERYEWRVTVQDEQGAGLASVPVIVYRAPLPEPGRVGGVREAVGKTDSGGVAALRGRRLGGKWLFVDGRPLGRTSSFVRCELSEGGQHTQAIVLPSGGSLVVRVGALDGSGLDWSNVWLRDDELGITLQGKTEQPGERLFVGLGAGSYTLHVHGDMDHSPACVRGLLAGGEPVVTRLKRRTDERDVGDHMAEIHGKVVDAATGEELALGSWDVEVLRAIRGASSSPFDRVVPAGPAQRMASSKTALGLHEVGLAPGRHALVASVPGYAMAVHEFEVAGNELHTGIVIALQRGGEVRGRVLDGSGRPLAGAVLQVIGVGTLADERLARLSADGEKRGGGWSSAGISPCWGRSGDDGCFELGRIPPGVLLRLCARSADGRVAVLDLGVLQSGDVVEDLVLRCE